MGSTLRLRCYCSLGFNGWHEQLPSQSLGLLLPLCFFSLCFRLGVNLPTCQWHHSLTQDLMLNAVALNAILDVDELPAAKRCDFDAHVILSFFATEVSFCWLHPDFLTGRYMTHTHTHTHLHTAVGRSTCEWFFSQVAIKDLEPIKVRYTSRRSQLESAPRRSRDLGLGPFMIRLNKFW